MAEIHPDPDLDGVVLPIELLSNLSLFVKNPKKTLLKRFPTYVVLKRFSKGEVICRQGEPGWTAFYILTPEDTVSILEHRRERQKGTAERAKVEQELTVFRQRVERRRAAPDDQSGRQMAMVFVALPKSGSGRIDQTMATRMHNALGVNVAARPMRNMQDQTFFPPVGAPVDRNVESFRAPLYEGQLFGEYSCLYRTPRTATIVASYDCYMIEMLRNIFLNVVQKDPTYAGPAAEMERKRFLDTHMPKLSLFATLTREEYAEVKGIVELVDFDPGQVIFDEHDRDNGVYVIRSGMVKELKNVSTLLARDDVADWNKLLAALREGEAAPKDYRGRLWTLLPESARSAVRRTPADQLPQRVEQVEVLLGLNDILKIPKLADFVEFSPACAALAASERGRELAAERATMREEARVKKAKEVPELSEAKLRRFNRLLLEEALPTILRRARHGAPECILNYYSPGDYVCGYGVLENQPSNVTGIAFDHPNNSGQVQLVRLPGDALRKACANNPTLKEKINRELSKRRKHSMQRLLTPVWDDSNQVQLSGRFEELGLIQGQRLMLIDLDRCTRCDECVKACVNTHDDGHSRLFLDGPRFGKYLVPISCRACLDPVCMMDCPVSSIHRGENREMVIEDWCIGCEICARACPYGSIQMHDLGLVKERTRGWRCATVEMAPEEKWFQPNFNDARWLAAAAPFQFDRVFRDLLEQASGAAVPKDEPIFFRYGFDVSPADLVLPGRGKGETKPVERLILIVTSFAAEVTVWLDGAKLPDCKPKQGRREYELPVKKTEGEKSQVVLGKGRHVLAVRAKPPVPAGKDLMMAGIYSERRPDLPEGAADEKVAEELTEKLVVKRAVVCDLCSSLPGKSPACVRACPHDAAFRINARKDFPQQ